MRHLCDASPSSWKSQGAGKGFAVERHLGLLLSGASAKGFRVWGLLKSCAVIVPSVSLSSAKLRRMLWRSTFQHIPTWTSHSQPVCTACRDPTRMCSTAPRCLLHSWSPLSGRRLVLVVQSSWNHGRCLALALDVRTTTTQATCIRCLTPHE